jgi:type II secretory pathway pseudopilin PulG
VSAGQRLRSESGYSLIELLVSAAIMLIVTGAIFTIVNPAQGNTQAQTEVADLQQRMRLGADVMFKELLMAGAGPYQGDMSGSLVNYFAPILPRRTGALSPDPPTTFRADTITLTHIPNTYSQTTIKYDMPITSMELKVNDVVNCPKHDQLCGFEEGMVVLIYDSSGHFDTFEITNVQDDAGHLQHRGQSLSYEYQAGAKVTQAVSNTYYRDATTNQLKRYNGGLTETPIVDNLVDLQFSYFGDPNPPKSPKPTTIGDSNCLYDATGSYRNLPVLPMTDGSLAELSPTILTDGPLFCGGGSNQYDPDLLRIRKVRIMMRFQVASAALRGSNTLLWKSPGKSQGAEKMVPDYIVTYEVTPRNLNLAR